MILYLHCLRKQSHREDEFKTCFKRDTVPCVINQRVYHCTCLTLMIIKKAEKSQLQVSTFFSSFPFIFFKWHPTKSFSFLMRSSSLSSHCKISSTFLDIFIKKMLSLFLPSFLRDLNTPHSNSKSYYRL